jgi:hypothetical protein
MNCAAISKNNTRCINARLNNSYHCAYHINKAKKLYLKYKETEEKVKTVNLDHIINNMVDTKIEDVENLYSIYYKIFKQREIHRRYYFHKDLHDEGHNYQFVKLQLILTRLENVLIELYSNINNNNSNSNSNNSNNNSNNNNNKVKELITKRQEILQYQSNLYIEKCINEAKHENAEKNILINYIKKGIEKLFIYNNELFAYNILKLSEIEGISYINNSGITIFSKGKTEYIENTSESGHKVKTHPKIYPKCKCVMSNDIDELHPLLKDMIISATFELVSNLLKVDFFRNYKKIFSKQKNPKFKLSINNLSDHMFKLSTNELKIIYEKILFEGKNIQFLMCHIICKLFLYSFNNTKISVKDDFFIDCYMLQITKIDDYILQANDVNMLSKVVISEIRQI